MGKKKKKEKGEEQIKQILEEEEPKENIPYLLSLYGKVEEEECSEIVHTLYGQKLACEAGLRDPKPIKFLISTHGGDAVEMFSVYDTMKHVQKTYPIHTIGVGKIMSAGTLLLAAGKKGKRRIGANCRLMIHNVKGMPPYPECFEILKMEIKEIEWFQERYIACLVKETHLCEEDIREVLESNQNVYLDAKEAVKCGFADKII
jgi:ATP-dependent Clp endopeptidase proteolytic subunit ClpP|tara:strand:+ start:10270 stop:10878 length:609 start_codon:yes stop_codon:yes gene_type:complete